MVAIETWTSSLSGTSPDGIVVRGYDLVELIGKVPFPSVLYLLYAGDLPDPATTRMLDALMVASIDHGPGAPSALAARLAVSGGASLQAAGAAGLLTMGEHHGAAVEDSLDILHQVVAGSGQGGEEMDGAAEQAVRERRSSGRRVPGFGHREHKARDPRVDRLFGLAEESGIAGSYIAAARSVERALVRVTGHQLPINIDGAVAAVLGDLGFPNHLANAVFIVSRLVGVMGHAAEERETMPPMRRIDPVNHGYSGPKPRTLPKDGPR